MAIVLRAVGEPLRQLAERARLSSTTRTGFGLNASTNQIVDPDRGSGSSCQARYSEQSSMLGAPVNIP